MNFGDVKSVAEFVYFLGGISLAITGGFAIKQINLAKKDMESRTKRDAASIAVVQCQRYVSEILPKIDQLFLAIKEREVPDYNGDIKTFTVDDLRENQDWFKSWTEKINEIEFIKLFMEVMNSLESFSVYFTKGVADAEIAFSSVGLTFCGTVKKYYPFIAFSRKKQTFNHYENIILLFNEWSSRLERQQLEEQSEMIKRKLDNTSSKGFSVIGS